jgi:L-lactate dehydrogenase complex protein LldG
LSKAQRIKSFTEKQQAVRGEVVLLKGGWTDWMDKHFKDAHLLIGTGELGDQSSDLKNPKAITHYDQPIESWKPDLFEQIDVSITTSHAGLAESGTLILKPTPQEPRLMSLVPPAHVAILDANRLYENFAELMSAEDWSEMPTNLLLISGPSKTADIEQTLAYGIHGPKRLITLIVNHD